MEAETLRKMLSKLLVSVCEKEGWKKTELASKLEVDKTYVQKLIKGERNVTCDTIDKYLARINRTHSDLLPH